MTTEPRIVPTNHGASEGPPGLDQTGMQKDPGKGGRSSRRRLAFVPGA